MGILRGRQALPDLEQALRSKDSDVIYEALVAIEKIRDPSAGPANRVSACTILKEKVQVTAIEATGLLANRAAINDLRDVLDRSRNMKGEARRAHRHGANARSAIARRLRHVSQS